MMHPRLAFAGNKRAAAAGGSAPTISSADGGMIPNDDSSMVVGTNFVDPTTFVWRGGYVTGDYADQTFGGAFVDATHCAVRVPYVSSGDYSLIATTVGGSSAPFAVPGASLGSQGDGASNPPDINNLGLSPASGTVGTTITATGHDFTQDMAFVFDSGGTPTECPLTSFTDQTTVTFARPAHSAIAVLVRAKNSDGTGGHSIAFLCT